MRDEEERIVSERPVRLVVSDELERSRLTAFFRLLLAIPHFIWLTVWSVGAFFAVIVSWFVTLATARTPASLHRFLAAYVKYVTQLYAYVNLAANPYPTFDGQDGYPVDLEIAPSQRQSRLRVAFRALLAVPAAAIAGALGALPSLSGSGQGRGQSSGGSTFFYSLGLLHVVAFLAWFAILARGRMPRGLRDAAAYALSYGAQFWAYALLLTDRYPNSDPQTALPELPRRHDPVAFTLADDRRRSRLTVFFRLPLAIPHLVWLSLWSVLVAFAVIASWFATLATGRTPAPLHRFIAAFLRYQVHVYGFLYLIANPFPGFVGRAGSYPLEAVIDGSARQNRWKTLFRAILVIPAVLLASVYGTLAGVAAVLGWFASLATGRMPLGLRNAAALAMRYSAQTTGYALLLSDAYPYSGPCERETGQEPAALGAASPFATSG